MATRSKKLKIATAAATILLAACATPSELRARKPTLDLTSNLPAKRVAVCIADGWENARMLGLPSSFPIHMRPTENGYEILALAKNLFSEWPGLMAEITDTPNGSKTIYYANKVVAEGDFERAVTACQSTDHGEN